MRGSELACTCVEANSRARGHGKKRLCTRGSRADRCLIDAYEEITKKKKKFLKSRSSQINWRRTLFFCISRLIEFHLVERFRNGDRADGTKRFGDKEISEMDGFWQNCRFKLYSGALTLELETNYPRTVASKQVEQSSDNRCVLW